MTQVPHQSSSDAIFDPDSRVGDLTEQQILEVVLARLRPARAAEIGPGDDAAVLAVPSGSIVVSCDTLVEGPDFLRAWSSGYDLGWKAAAVNLADIAAMGARPTALLVALTLPKDLTLGYIAAVADGLSEACAELAPGCAVVGGDLGASGELMIAVTALGEMAGTPPVTRSGAQPGDTVAIAGEMGLAATGLEILRQKFWRDGSPLPQDLGALTEAEQAAVRAQLQPSPPIRLGVIAAAAGAHAMMDVSDGLALDAQRMAEASGVVLDLAGTALGATIETALFGGEDHALLATFAPGQVPVGFRPIGHVRQLMPGQSPGVWCDGQSVRVSGWDPYRNWSATA